MSDGLDRLRASLRAIRVEEDPDRVFVNLRDTLLKLGFTAVVIGQVDPRQGGHIPQPGFHYNHGIGTFLEEYRTQGYQFSDPVAARAATTHRPFRWREAYVDMSPAQLAQREAAVRHGLSFGYIFPQMQKPGPSGFVSIGRATDFELDAESFMELEFLTRYSYDRIVGLLGLDRPIHFKPLSPREAAILTHIANGKTNWETGQILGVSEYSVRDHMRRLADRFGTDSRTHTVVKAIQSGLLLP